MSEYLMKSGEIKTDQNIYRNRGNKSIPLPKDWKPYHYDSLGIEAPVLATPKPTPTSLTKTVYRDGVTTDANGNTVQNWTEKPMFSDYTDDNGNLVTQGEQEGEYLAKLLNDAKEAKKAELKDARNTAIEGTVEVTISSGTYIVDANQVNRSNMHQAIDNAVIAGLTDADTTTWKMGDNSFVVISFGDMKLLGLQLASFINTEYGLEAQKVAQVDAATTIEEVEAI